MIIGISGYARSGKDTVAKYLVENHGFKRIAFADAIRHMLLDLDPYVGIGYSNNSHITISDLVSIEGWDNAKSHPEIRRLLQDLGVSARQHLGEDVWIKAALRTLSNGEPIVITDVRFKNEADAIKDLNGKIWRVIRPGVDAVNGHISETQMDRYPVDDLILNDGDIKKLENEVLMRMPIRL
jgi:hypothetical protein